jgi:hypothetical protein
MPVPGTPPSQTGVAPSPSPGVAPSPSPALLECSPYWYDGTGGDGEKQACECPDGGVKKGWPRAPPHGASRSRWWKCVPRSCNLIPLGDSVTC